MQGKGIVIGIVGVLFAALGVLFWSSASKAPNLYGGSRSTTKPEFFEPVGPPPPGLEKATFASGCFWCSEAVFQKLKGVYSVVAGYSGGSLKNPSYAQIGTGTTGHAEAIQVSFDPKVVSYAELLEVFWKTHDPTTLNRQGADEGPQYRSAIFYHSDEQMKLALEYKKKLDASGIFGIPIVTQIVPFIEFYPAEEKHQHFYALNPDFPYCQIVIGPKLQKLEALFHDKLKEPAQ